MTERDMSYSLDGVFSTRNQGQLVATQPTQTKMIRTPGLMPVSAPLANFGHAMGAETNPAVTAPETINLPVFGEVSKKTAVLGLALAIGGFLWWRQRG